MDRPHRTAPAVRPASAGGTTQDFELWDHGAPPAVAAPSDLTLRPDGVPDSRERQLAEGSLLVASDLPGYAPASATTVEATYARCWDGTGILSESSPDRAATALSPVYSKGTTNVATAVVLTRTPAASTAAMVFAASVGSPFPEEERRRLATVVAGRLPT